MWEVGYSVSVVNSMDGFLAQVVWLREAGFQAIQIPPLGAAFGEGAGPDPSALGSNGWRRLREELATFSMLEVHALTPIPPHEPWEAVEGLRPVVEFAGELGASLLTIHGHAPDRQAEPDNASWQEAVDRLNAIAARAGVMVGLENLPEFEAFRGPRRPNVGVTLDIGHASMDMGHCWPGTLGDLVRFLGDTLVHVHVHDFDGTLEPLPVGETHDHRELGTGFIDFDEWLGAIVEVNYQGTFMLELNEKHVSPEGVLRSRGWFQHKIAELG